MIRVEQVSKAYGRVQALRGISLRVEKGTLHGLIGPDGAGKSSLMHIVAGVLAHDSGCVWVAGTQIKDEASAESVKACLGLMPQGLGLNLYPTLSVEENLMFFARLRDVPPSLARQRITKLLEMTRMAPFRTRQMRHLSGGMMQKLGLMCTLIHEPKLLILDEPTTGVDPVSRREFWALLTQLVLEKGITALVSTAYMDEAARFDNVSLMHEGRVLEDGPPQRLIERMAYEVLLLDDARALALLPAFHQQWPEVSIEVNGTLVRLLNQKKQTEAIVQWWQSRRISPVRLEPGLEDLFLIRQGATQSLETSFAALKPVAVDAPVRIQASNLVRRFGDFTAVNGVSFQVRGGEIFGLLGANGAGKTTLIRMLTGLLPPTAGAAMVAGVHLNARASRKVRSHIGYMAQHFSLYGQLTITENLTLFGKLYNVPAKKLKERMAWGIEWAGLEPYRHMRAGGLPMGIRQRLALLAAVLHEPSVLFLDEPTSGVDPVGRRHFWSLLRHLASEQGVAILVTTHVMSEAENCHRLVLMRAGEIVAQGAPQALKQRLLEKKGQLMRLEVSDPWWAWKLLQERHDAFLVGRQVHLFTPTPERTIEDIRQHLAQHGITLRKAQPIPPTMEEVFIETVEGRL